MTATSYLARMYDHLFWADERVLKLMEGGTAGVPDAARGLFAHVLASERVWLLRLRGEDSSVQPIWPTLSTEEMRALAASNGDGFARLLDALDEAGLSSIVEYTNQQGRAYRTAAGDILAHVALHGAYHRGQVARAVREAGGEPVSTDFILFVREQPEPGAAAPPAASGRG